jgi:hypothetical protein
MKTKLTKQIVTILIAVFITTATANAIGTLTPAGTAGDQTHYNLNDIYTKITTGNSTSTKSGTISVPEGTPTASFRTLTEIYEALPEWRTLSDSTTTVQEGYYEATDLVSIDPDLIASNIATGTEMFGVVGTYQSFGLLTSPHAYFPLRGSVSDVSENNWSSSSGSDNWTTNRFGTVDSAKDFPNSTSHQIVIDRMIQPQTGEITICAWINPDNVSGDHMIITDYDGFTGSDETINYWISSNRYGFLVYGNNTAYSLSGVASTGSWDFYCGVTDSSTIKLYENGLLVANEAATNPLRTDTTDSWYVGNAINGTRVYDGQISDILIYDTALSSTEISDLYDATDDEQTYNQFLVEFN